MTSVVRSVVTCQADADVSLPSPLLLSPFLALSLVPFSLPPFILPSLPPPPLSIFLRLSLSPPPPPDATRERNPIRAPLALSLPRLFSRNVSSRFDPRDHPLPPLPSTADFSSSPFPSQGFSPFFRAHPRSFPPPHCASFHPRPSLASSRSFRRLCQWRDPRPFSRSISNFP